MQPMVSPVDHESRNNSYRAQDYENQGASESTPLIHRFPPSDIPQHRSLITTVVVGILLLTLLTGVIIGIRLLILQDEEENILPPVDSHLVLVSRLQWDNVSAPLLGLSQLKAEHLVTVQTDTRECADLATCSALLHEMKASLGQNLPYNFLLSSNGQAYEAMGWRASTLFPEYSTLVLAFIGNFTETPPTRAQMKAAGNFFDFGESQQLLKSSFVIIGKNTKYSPKYLYQSLKKYPQWSNELSDR